MLENDVSDFTASKTKASSKITVKQNYYEFDSLNSYFDTDFYNLVFGTGTYYWLASRYSFCGSEFANFGLRVVGEANLGGLCIFGSNTYAGENSYLVVPVVSLKSNIKYTSAGSGVWNIEKIR